MLQAQHLQQLRTWLAGISREFAGVSRREVMSGLKIAVIILFPLLVAAWLGKTEQGIAVSLGGMFTALASGGGAYRTRARNMAMGACLMVLSCLLSSLAGGQPFLVSAFILLWVFSVSMLSVLGGAGTRVGSVAAIFAIIQLSTPAVLADLPARCGLVLLGSLLAMAAGLWSWPLRPLQPVRDSLAEYYQSLRSLLASSNNDGETWREQVKIQRTRAITCSTVLEAMKGRGPAPRRMHHLLQKADSLFAVEVALVESMRVLPPRECQDLLQKYTGRTAAAADQALSGIVSGLRKAKSSGTIDDLAPVLKEITETIERNDNSSSNAQHILHLLEMRLDLLQEINEILDGKKDEAVSVDTSDKKDLKTAARDAYRLLRENLSLRSPHFCHALRLTLVVSLATAAYEFLRLPYGYWMPLAAAIILKPDLHATRERLWHRVGGTLAGGIVAFAAAALIHNTVVLLLLIGFFSFLAFVYRPRHYGIYAVFLTPFVVLSIDIAHLGSWLVALDRVLYNIAGSLLAAAAIYQLWPRWEEERLLDHIDRVFETNRRFFHTVLTVNRPESAAALSPLANLECARAIGSLQRHSKEPPSRKGDFEKLRPLVMGSQRLCSTLTALTVRRSPLLEAEARSLMQRLNKQKDSGRPDKAPVSE